MALTTAINFLVFCLAFLATRPQSGLMRLVTSPTNGGAVARRLLPMAVLVPWAIGGVLLAAEQKNYFRTDTAISMFAVASILIFSMLVWWNAKLLYRADQERLVTQERLHQASANLERSNTELQQFAYTASHDLNEPLRMITSYLQLLQDRLKGKLDVQTNEFIDYAMDGAERMRALIADLLAYSRLDAQKDAFEETDSEEVFDTAIQNLRVAIEENKATISHAPLPRVCGDPLQLTQVFQNLIANALKFHGEQPPSIQIEANRQNEHWVFSVRDNGIGIESKDFDRIFVIFQRLHTRQEYSGTGMGLSICKKIVERHGGRIWVESAPRKGSTFYFTLPVMRNGTG
jgi:light-regulated signal transduction histidine kinase (bacteriophytochrome)